MAQHNYCPGCNSKLVHEVQNGEAAQDYATRIEIRRVHPGALFLQCPHCLDCFHLWPQNHPLHARAEPYIRQWNSQATMTMAPDGVTQSTAGSSGMRVSSTAM